MRKINLAIVEDDINLCNILTLYINNLYSTQINIVGVANNSEDGYKIINEQKPDIVLIDVIMPVSDGISLLEKLNESGLINSMCCIMLTAIGSTNIIKSAMELGASYYFMKPYDIEKLIKRIIDIYIRKKIACDIKEEDDKKALVKVEFDNTLNSYADFFENKVDEIVGQNPARYAAMSTNFIGIPPNLSGYSYLKYAVEAVINDPCLINALTKTLYPRIGKVYNSNSTKVERSIRNCLKIAWIRNGGVKYCEFFGRLYNENHKKPTSGLLIMELSTFYINSQL